MIGSLRITFLAAAATLLVAAPAQAAFTLAEPAAAPAALAAGANSDFKVHVAPQGGQIKDLDLHLPPGVIGDPRATTRCTIVEFEGDQCGADTVVGTSTTTVRIGPLTQNANGTIYNLIPRGTEPARLGIKIVPPVGDTVRLESPVTSRADGGLDSTLTNLPRQVGGMDMTIIALDVLLKGKVKGGRGFMRNPTSCGPAQTVIDARSYAGEATQAKASFTPTGCEALPFVPGFGATLGEPGLTARRARPPLTTVVTQGPGEAGVKSVAVTLPTTLAVGLDQLARACPAETFAAGACPDVSQIGTATAATPLLADPLQGPVAFVVGTGALPDLQLQLRGPLALTLKGTNTLSRAGQVTTFEGIPDVPLDRFELAFFGGTRGLLSLTRDVCVGKAPRLQATFTAHSGATRTVSVPATIVGCEPQVAVTLGKLGKRLRPSARVRIDKGHSRLRRVKVTLPSGLTPLAGAGAKVTGSGAGKVTLRRTGRVYEIAVPGGGARSLSLRFKQGTLRARKGLKTPGFRVEITDVSGDKTTRTVSPGR